MQGTSIRISTKGSLEGHELNMHNCSVRGQVWNSSGTEVTLGGERSDSLRLRVSDLSVRAPPALGNGSQEKELDTG